MEVMIIANVWFELILIKCCIQLIIFLIFVKAKGVLLLKQDTILTYYNTLSTSTNVCQLIN
jgi:hypothetical protein